MEEMHQNIWENDIFLYSQTHFIIIRGSCVLMYLLDLYYNEIVYACKSVFALQKSTFDHFPAESKILHK